MVKKLLVIWVLALVAFFGLWALAVFIVRRISAKRQQEVTAREEADDTPSTPEPSQAERTE